jgi:hypothetical protein
MSSFDPSLNHEKFEAYLNRFLESPVEFIRAEILQQSTRAAPWRLDVRVNGEVRSYVLQTDPDGMQYEYDVLKAMASIPLPTPHPYGLDLQGEALGVACFFSDFIEGVSLLGPMLTGEPWAEKLYLNTVCALQALTETDLAIDSVYNTYAYGGLPPRPICSPDISTLQAVAYPDLGQMESEIPFLYFRSAFDGSGRHQFAVSFEEHLLNECP